MPDLNDRGAVTAILDAGATLAEVAEFTPDTDVAALAAVVPAGYQLQVRDLNLDSRRERPRRKTGTVTVEDTPSFIAYYLKHRTPNTEVYADRENGTVTAVLNASGPSHERVKVDNTDDPGDLYEIVEPVLGWGDHRLVLKTRPSKPWTTWRGYDGRLMPQADFAQVIEDMASDIVDPSPGVMLEVAASLEARKQVDFDQSVRLDSGQRRFTYRETIAARAGQTGELEIPSTFVVLLQPYWGGPGVRVTARLRYRISQDGLKLGFRFERLDDHVDAVWASLLGEIGEALGDLTIMNGRPS